MTFKLKHNISVRETGFVIQPLLYWLAVSPDMVVHLLQNQVEKKLFFEKIFVFFYKLYIICRKNVLYGKKVL